MKKNCSMIFVWTINPQGLPKSQNLSRETLLQSVWVRLWCWNVSQMENPRLLFIGSTQLMVKVSCWEVLKSIYEPPWQKKRKKRNGIFLTFESQISHIIFHTAVTNMNKGWRVLRQSAYVTSSSWMMLLRNTLSFRLIHHSIVSFICRIFLKQTFAGVDESIRNESWHGDLFSSTCIFDKNFLCSRVLLG